MTGGEDLEYKATANHTWRQITTCLNGPHVWRCEVCGDFTRSFGKPKPGAILRDPDNGQQYGSLQTLDPRCKVNALQQKTIEVALNVLVDGAANEEVDERLMAALTYGGKHPADLPNTALQRAEKVIVLPIAHEGFFAPEIDFEC